MSVSAAAAGGKRQRITVAVSHHKSQTFLSLGPGQEGNGRYRRSVLKFEPKHKMLRQVIFATAPPSKKSCDFFRVIQCLAKIDRFLRKRSNRLANKQIYLSVCAIAVCISIRSSDLLLR